MASRSLTRMDTSPSPLTRRAGFFMAASFCQLHKFIALNFTVAQNFQHRPWTDDFTTMHRDNGPPAVCMPQKMMTSFDTQDFKSRLLQCGDDFLPCEPRYLRHHTSIAILCTPINSFETISPCISR